MSEDIIYTYLRNYGTKIQDGLYRLSERRVNNQLLEMCKEAKIPIVRRNHYYVVAIEDRDLGLVKAEWL